MTLGAKLHARPDIVADAVRGATETARSTVQHRIGRSSATKGHATELQIDKVFDLVFDKVLRRSAPPAGPIAGATLLVEIIDCVCRFGTQACDDPNVIIDIADALCEPAPGPGIDLSADGGPTEVGLGLGLRSRVARLLLLGTPGAVGRRVEAGVLGIDTDRNYLTFRARPKPGCRREALAAELTSIGAGQDQVAMAAEVDGDVIGFSTEPLGAVAGGVVGVGPVAAFDQLADSFQLASQAMDVAVAFGLTGAHAFDDLGLLPTILADTDVGQTMWLRYLQPLARVESGVEIVYTLRTYFACGMHVDRAAAALTLHPNTLRNRISRFEELLGADLRDVNVAMQVWWALQYGTLIDEGPGRPIPERVSR